MSASDQSDEWARSGRRGSPVSFRNKSSGVTLFHRQLPISLGNVPFRQRKDIGRRSIQRVVACRLGVCTSRRTNSHEFVPDLKRMGYDLIYDHMMPFSRGRRRNEQTFTDREVIDEVVEFVHRNRTRRVVVSGVMHRPNVVDYLEHVGAVRVS